MDEQILLNPHNCNSSFEFMYRAECLYVYMLSIEAFTKFFQQGHSLYYGYHAIGG